MEFAAIVDEVKKFVETDPRFGATPEERRDLLYEGGLRIYTTIDPVAQREAVRAVRKGLHAYEDRHGKHWRGKLTNILDQKPPADLAHYSHPDWMGDYAAGEYIYGLVTSVGASSAEVRFGDYKAALTDAGSAGWPLLCQSDRHVQDSGQGGPLDLDLPRADAAQACSKVAVV
jgi:penicillin-binding protein 1A